MYLTELFNRLVSDTPEPPPKPLDAVKNPNSWEAWVGSKACALSLMKVLLLITCS